MTSKREVLGAILVHFGTILGVVLGLIFHTFHICFHLFIGVIFSLF